MCSLSKISTCAALVGALVLGGAVAINAHGYVGNEKSDVMARVAMSENVNRGSVQYEPQSIEGPKGFSLDLSTRGPADWQLASGGNYLALNLDEQSPGRWVENQVTAGSTIAIGWEYTAQHMTAKWHYYNTKTGWDQNSPLARAKLKPLATVEHDGSLSLQGTAHDVKLPADLRGSHVILAVWDVADTANAFYNTIDVNLSGGAVDHYEIHRADKGEAFTKLNISNTVRYQDTTVSADKDYEYRVIAFDAAGNRSEASETLSVTNPRQTRGRTLSPRPFPPACTP